MSANKEFSPKKIAFFEKLNALVQEYPKILVVGANNVGSSHMQRIRISLRGEAVVLMGKNTMIRKALRGQVEAHPELEQLIPNVRGNVGFVFTKSDLQDIRKKLLELRVEAAAKVGATAPNDVIVPAGNTGLEPTQTSFLQALNIPSRINKGQVEIINDVHLIHTGDKVGSSEAALLQKLSIKPFQYGLSIELVYDEGSLYPPSVMDISEADIIKKFFVGVQSVAALSLRANHPTVASVSHSLINGFKKLLAIALTTEYSFEAADKIKEMIKNPGAFAAAAPAPQVHAPAPSGKPAPVVEAEPEEEEPEEEMGAGGLFGEEEEW